MKIGAEAVVTRHNERLPFRTVAARRIGAGRLATMGCDASGEMWVNAVGVASFGSAAKGRVVQVTAGGGLCLLNVAGAPHASGVGWWASRAGPLRSVSRR